MTTIASTTPTERDALLAGLEELWRCFDELVATFTPRDWARKHGKDWTFADVPYHLSYFDRDVVARPIERGSDVPPAEQRVHRTGAELDGWNAEKFAARPAGQTVAQSLEQMRAGREAIRRAVAGLTDADLDRQGWCHLLGTGWITVRLALTACLGHTWGHYSQLRLYARRTGPLPRPEVTHAALSFYAGVLPGFVNRDLAAKTTLTAVMEFTGPGGGAWTYRVAGGRCTTTRGRAERPDLVITQSSDTFVKTFAKMQNPMLALLTGKMKVKGFRKMGTFGKLFGEPKPTDTIEPGAFAAATA